MYCTNCGKELPSGSSVCSECGTEFASEEKSAKTEASSDNHRPYMDYQQNFHQQQNSFGYDHSQEIPEGHSGLAIAGFVLGILGTCSCCIPLINIPLGIVGLILSILGIKSRYRGLAIAGVVLSSIAIVLGILTVLAIIVSSDTYTYYYWNFID